MCLILLRSSIWTLSNPVPILLRKHRSEQGKSRRLLLSMAAGLKGEREGGGRVFMACTRSQEEEDTESPLGGQRGMERRRRKKEKGFSACSHPSLPWRAAWILRFRSSFGGEKKASPSWKIFGGRGIHTTTAAGFPSNLNFSLWEYAVQIVFNKDQIICGLEILSFLNDLQAIFHIRFSSWWPWRLPSSFLYYPRPSWPPV